jgi:hypothetical protein
LGKSCQPSAFSLQPEKKFATNDIDDTNKIMVRHAAPYIWLRGQEEGNDNLKLKIENLKLKNGRWWAQPTLPDHKTRDKIVDFRKSTLHLVFNRTFITLTPWTMNYELFSSHTFTHTSHLV